MNTLFIFSALIGLLLACCVGAMFWGERLVVRATAKHRSS